MADTEGHGAINERDDSGGKAVVVIHRPPDDNPRTQKKDKDGKEQDATGAGGGDKKSSGTQLKSTVHRPARDRRSRPSRHRRSSSESSSSRERSRHRSRLRSRRRYSRSRSRRRRSRSRSHRRTRSRSYKRYSRSRSRTSRRSRSYRSRTDRSRNDRRSRRSRSRTDRSRRSRSRTDRSRRYRRSRSRSSGYKRYRSHSRRRGYSDFRSETGSKDRRVVVDRNWNDSDKTDYDFSEGEDVEAITTLYAKRLMLVDSMCELGLQPVEVEEQTAFGAKERVNMVHLPAAEGFPRLLHSYMEEVKGTQGSRRARLEPKLPLDIGRFPSRVRPNPKAIVVEDHPWLNSACQANTSLLSSQCFKFQVPPKIVVDQDKMRAWESSAREEFTMASYNTWFLKAARTGIGNLQQKVSDITEAGKVTKKDWEAVWKSLEKVQGLIDSAGVGTKKVAENCVSDIGSMLLVRRDSWLKKLCEDRVITKQDMWDLRQSDINEQSLFSQIELERIHDSALSRDSNTLTKKLLESLAKNQQKGNQGSQSFRGGPSGQPRTSGSSSTRGGSSSGSSRGRGRGRGGRGGGKKAPFKPDFPNKTTEFHTSKDK